MKTTRKQQKQQQISLQERLISKLNPSRYPNMSTMMAAIVGHLLDAPFARPRMTEIVVASDGFLFARADGEVGANHFIGHYADLLKNWYGLLAVARLTEMERLAAPARFAVKIGFYGRTDA